jgi:uncharacterized protein (DUF362 family)
MGITRRRFVKGLGVLSICVPFTGSLVAPLFGEREAIASDAPSKVVVLRDAKALKDGSPVPEVVDSMLKDGLENLLGCGIREGMKSLFGGAKEVGIKINTLGGKPLATRKEVAYGLAGLIVNETEGRCGVTIWDRSEREIERAGFDIERKGSIKCLATDSEGIGYERFVRESGAVGSKFSRLLTERADQVVSLAVLKDHGIAGISACMKNFYGAIHNPNKYHPNGCNPYVADLFSHDMISKRHRLSIVDGLVGIYGGGPGYKPKYRWEFKGLIFGIDAVAVDRVCLELIEEKRAEVGIPSLKDEKRYPQYVFTAGAMAVGCSRLEKIDLIQIDKGI